MFYQYWIGKMARLASLAKWRVMAERFRAPDANSGVYDQQNVGSSPSSDTCVLKQDTYP